MSAGMGEALLVLKHVEPTNLRWLEVEQVLWSWGEGPAQVGG